MFEIIAIILCVIALVLLLTYLYQRKQITKIAEADNRPFPSYEYDYYIGKYCPEGYKYSFESPNDTCTSEINSNLHTSFTPYTSKDWPPKKNDPGLTNRCNQLNQKQNWTWRSISNLCATLK